MCTGIGAGISDCGGALVAAKLSLLWCPQSVVRAFVHQADIYETPPTEAGTVVAAPLDFTAS